MKLADILKTFIPFKGATTAARNPATLAVTDRKSLDWKGLKLKFDTQV